MKIKTLQSLIRFAKSSNLENLSFGFLMDILATSYWVISELQECNYSYEEYLQQLGNSSWDSTIFRYWAVITSNDYELNKYRAQGMDLYSAIELLQENHNYPIN